MVRSIFSFDGGALNRNFNQWQTYAVLVDVSVANDDGTFSSACYPGYWGACYPIRFCLTTDQLM